MLDQGDWQLTTDTQKTQFGAILRELKNISPCCNGCNDGIVSALKNFEPNAFKYHV